MSARIFVIEDDDTLRSSLVRILVSAGYAVYATPTAVGAIDEMRRERPEILLLDMILEGSRVSGWELAQQMKDDPDLCTVPTIAISGLPASEIHARGRKQIDMVSEIRIMLDKPVDAKRLLAAVDYVLRLRATEKGP